MVNDEGDYCRTNREAPARNWSVCSHRSVEPPYPATFPLGTSHPGELRHATLRRRMDRLTRPRLYQHPFEPLASPVLQPPVMHPAPRKSPMSELLP